MFGFGKKKETASASSPISGNASQVQSEGAAIQVKVLGAGCAKCHELNENAKKAIEGLGVNAELEYLTDMERVMSYGVINLPALVVNGRVVSSGMVLSPAEVGEYIK